MKKFISTIKIILVLAFAAASVYLSINLINIKEGQAFIESVIEKDVKYFNDDFFLRDSYYRFKDDQDTIYAINKKTYKFDYLKKVDLKGEKELSQSEALKLAYDEAKKWDADFFKYDTSFDAIDSTSHQFYIFQTNEEGYSTGKFIMVQIASSQVKRISMHTSKEQICLISEEKAIEIAYNATLSTSLPLYKEDNYLVKVDFRVENKKTMTLDPLVLTPQTYYWHITIYSIDADIITNQKDTISHYPKFNCTVNAISGRLLSSGWAENKEE